MDPRTEIAAMLLAEMIRGPKGSDKATKVRAAVEYADLLLNELDRTAGRHDGQAEVQQGTPAGRR